ncbi:MAG: hypothetical protein WBI17_11005 [Clostridiaceae bacterium]
MKKAKMLVAILSLAMLTACGGTAVESTSKTDGDATVKETEVKENEVKTPEAVDKVYKIGERVVVEDKYAITLLSIKATDQRNEFSETEVSQVLIIDYLYENLTNSEEDIYISDYNFKIVDSGGNMMDSYPILGIYVPAYTPVGAKSLSSMVYGTITESKSVKILYYDNFFSSDAIAEFELNIGDTVEYSLEGTLPTYNKMYKVGDIIEIKTNEGDYTLSIDKVEKTSDRNQFDESNPADVYMITYTYSNISLADNLYISESDFGLVDSTGTMGFSYPGSMNKYPNETVKGAKCTAEMTLASHTSGNQLILTYRDNFFSDSADVYIVVDKIN